LINGDGGGGGGVFNVFNERRGRCWSYLKDWINDGDEFGDGRVGTNYAREEQNFFLKITLKVSFSGVHFF
jgi:hypothetical protein